MSSNPECVAYLFMVFHRDVETVDFNDPVTLEETRSLSWALFVHLSDELPGSRFLGVEIEAVAIKVGPFNQVTQTRCWSLFRQIFGRTRHGSLDALLCRFLTDDQARQTVSQSGDAG